MTDIQTIRNVGEIWIRKISSIFIWIYLLKFLQDWRLRAGDWEAEMLSEKQINYAANDALVAVNILWVLLKQELETPPFSR